MEMTINHMDTSKSMEIMAGIEKCVIHKLAEIHDYSLKNGELHDCNVEDTYKLVKTYQMLQHIKSFKTGE